MGHPHTIARIMEAYMKKAMIIISALVYVISPIDFLPDFIPTPLASDCREQWGAPKTPC
jgi:hypothetical protein